MKSAIYNAASDTVTLHASRSLKVGQLYQLTLEGSGPAGLASMSGVMLDATLQDSEGSNYATILSRQNYVINLPGPSAKARARRDAIVHPHRARR